MLGFPKTVSLTLSFSPKHKHTHACTILHNSWGKRTGWYSLALVMKTNLNACCNESSHNGSCGILTSFDSSVNLADYMISVLRRIRQNVTNEANITTEKTSIDRTSPLARILNLHNQKDYLCQIVSPE